MSLSSQTFVLIALFAPLYFLIFLRGLQTRRRVRREEFKEFNETRPFGSTGLRAQRAPVSGISLPAYFYLKKQRLSFIWIYGGMAYASLVVLSSGLLPGNVDRYGLQQSLPERVWYSYLLEYSVSGIYLSLFTTILALIVVLSLITSGPAFLRTRPISIRILFWGRVGSIYIALLAGVATGAACSFLMLLLFYGPVWKHLFDAAWIVVPNLHHLPAAVRLRGLPGTMYLTIPQSHHLILALQTSALRLALALVAGCSVVFCSVVAIYALPARLFGTALVRTLFVLASVIALQMAAILSPHFAKVSQELFLSPHLGHPPPYEMLSVPMLFSLLLLLLAQQAAARKEL